MRPLEAMLLTDEKPVLQKLEISRIFSIADQLAALNGKLLTDLEAEVDSSGQVGKLFSEFIPYLKMYPFFSFFFFVL